MVIFPNKCICNFLLHIFFPIIIAVKSKICFFFRLYIKYKVKACNRTTGSFRHLYMHAETPECLIVEFQLDFIFLYNFGHIKTLSANVHGLSANMTKIVANITSNWNSRIQHSGVSASLPLFLYSWKVSMCVLVWNKKYYNLVRNNSNYITEQNWIFTKVVETFLYDYINEPAWPMAIQYPSVNLNDVQNCKQFNYPIHANLVWYDCLTFRYQW